MDKTPIAKQFLADKVQVATDSPLPKLCARNSDFIDSYGIRVQGRCYIRNG